MSVSLFVFMFVSVSVIVRVCVRVCVCQCVYCLVYNAYNVCERVSALLKLSCMFWAESQYRKYV